MFKKSVIAALLAFGLLSQVSAAQMSVSKLRINLENGQTADFLSLKNQSKATKEAFEISIQRWTQKNNLGGKAAPEDVLESTEDILISPKTLVILPEQDKVIRLILNNSEAATKNYSYRMIITQLPNKEAGAPTNTINLLFKISLPVFIYKDPIKTADKMSIEHKITTENGKRVLTIKNNDTQHIQISTISMGETKITSSHYILPGITNTIELPAEFNESNLAKNPLEISTDKGIIK